ncbi:MAG: glutamate cyclase domain-containing protein, partial [Candidatus Rokuibacteriota bacterium]
DLFLAAGARGVLTVAIGDGGNEVGMGGLRDIVESHVPNGKTCGCGCGGGIAAQSEAAALVTAVVANLGASAIAASLALLTGRRDVLASPELEMRSLAACAAAGAVDGQHNECVDSADGLGSRAYAAVLETIAAVVERRLKGR